jgi:anoctamin-10
MLPPSEKSPILVLQWSNKALKSDIIPMVKKELEKGGIILVPNTAPDALLLTATQENLEKQAETQRLIKKRTISLNETIMDHFQVANRSQFLTSSPNRDPSGLFSANERSQLVLGILERIIIKEEQLKQMLVESDHKGTSSGLRYLLQSHEWIHTLAPLHSEEKKFEIQTSTMWPLWQIMPPIDLIQEYYGPSVAYYFAFMGTLAFWSGILGILGLSSFLFRLVRQDTIDEDEYTPFYGLLCFVWAILFYRFWERKENTLAYQFGTLELSNLVDDFEQDYDYSIGTGGHGNPEFHGTMRKSPVTEQPELYYPPFQRKLHYLVSAVVTMTMLAIAFSIMILSLNLQGYIKPKGDAFHPFYYPRLASLAADGQIFDSMSSWRCFIPVVIHAVSILTLNTIYRRIAKKLTDWENHKLQTDYDNSLILKRFLFEAFDCYIALFYLAFYACDVDRLRMELIAVFNIDSFRRILTEVVIPMCLHKINKKVVDDGHPQDLDLNEYESFDDWMEVLIQFGYVTLFASAYPLASLVMFGALMIEMRSDCYKLTYLCQKPTGEQVSNIGMWKHLLQFMVWFSCLTNCLLFGFTSDQMMHYMPNFYFRDDEGVTHMVHDKGWVAILVIFALERVLIYLGLGLNAMIPSIPEKLEIQLKRRKYVLHVDKKKVE